MEIKIRLDIEENHESVYDVAGLSAETYDAIYRKIRDGDQWAWCTVIVTATLLHDGQLFTGTDNLGGCSYKDEADFKKDGYYTDMKERAIEDLWRDVRETGQRGLVAIGLLALKAQGHLPEIKEE